MQRHFLFLVVLVTLQLFFINGLMAEPIELEQIVVTPQRTNTAVSQNPSATDVVFAEQARSQGFSTLTDAIKDIPSLSYATTGSLGGVTTVFIRGADSEHTQVVLDDIRLYDPVVTSAFFYGYNHMSLDNLERVEVSKGPFSSLYGSDSIGGTINMITRKGKGRPTVSYTQEFGSYQTSREALSSQGKVKDLAYSFSISQREVRDFFSARRKNGNPETDPYKNINSSLRLDYALGEDIEVGLLTDYTYAKYEYDGDSGFPNYIPSDDNDNQASYHQGVVGVNFNQKLNDVFSHKATLGYTRIYRRDWQSETTHAWYDGKTYQGKWLADYQLFDFDKLIVGFDYLRELGESRYFYSSGISTSPKETNQTKGYYIENIFTPIEDLFFAASYRLEDNGRFDTKDVYSVSGSYLLKKTDTKIKASVGEGFKAPSLYQLFNGLYGNIDLSPEESKTYEIGLEQGLWDSVKLGSTYFYTHINDLIEFNWPAGYVNSGKSRIYGIESSFEYLINDRTTFKTSYTHMDTKKTADGTRLLRRPNNKVTCELDTAFDKLNMHFDLSYVGNRIDVASVKLKPYLLANANFNYTANEKLSLFLKFENILDRDYELVSDYQTPKFSSYLGAKVTF